MLTSGKAVKVILYLSDGAKHHGVPVYSSILDFLFHSGIAGATVVKGVAGFGQAHRIHSANILDISDHLPVKIEFIETREKVDEILGELEMRAGSGLIELQETTVIVPGQDAH
jgi:PII-like signaling protein